METGLDDEKSVEEWDKEWKSIRNLELASLTPYSKYVGLYRHRIGRKIIYIGRATELYNGGLRKRLRDYARPNDSARNTDVGRFIYNNLNRITTDILIIGDRKKDISTTIFLEGPFIKKYKPSMNTRPL